MRRVYQLSVLLFLAATACGPADPIVGEWESAALPAPYGINGVETFSHTFAFTGGAFTMALSYSYPSSSWYADCAYALNATGEWELRPSGEYALTFEDPMPEEVTACTSNVLSADDLTGEEVAAHNATLVVLAADTLFTSRLDSNEFAFTEHYERAE